MIQGKKIIIEPNYTETSLVPYVPCGSKRRFGLAVFEKLEGYFDGHYIKRFKYYYTFLMIAFVLAILGGGLFSRFPKFAEVNADKLAAEYRIYGFSFAFVFRNFFGYVMAVSIAFLSGFTVFSMPVSVLCYSRIMLSAFYLYGKAVNGASYGFYLSFSTICIFATFVFACMIFFAETATAYRSLADSDSDISFFTKYVLCLVAFILIVAFLLYLGLMLLIPQ